MRNVFNYSIKRVTSEIRTLIDHYWPSDRLSTSPPPSSPPSFPLSKTFLSAGREESLGKLSSRKGERKVFGPQKKVSAPIRNHKWKVLVGKVEKLAPKKKVSETFFLGGWILDLIFPLPLVIFWVSYGSETFVKGFAGINFLRRGYSS